MIKKVENKSLFFEYAALHFKVILESKIRDREKEAFKVIKDNVLDKTFNTSSRKIFFKIGLGTLLLFSQKFDEKSTSYAFKKLKKKIFKDMREEQRISILRKKFHRIKD